MAEFTAWKMINPKELQDYLKENGVSGVAEYVSSRLHAWKNVEIQLSAAVCDVSGSGKSSFIQKKKEEKKYFPGPETPHTASCISKYFNGLP